MTTNKRKYYPWRGTRPSYVCLDCRKSIKGGNICPECGQPMRLAGKAFAAPRRESDSQWRKVRMLLLAGYRFHRDDRHDGGPKSLADGKRITAKLYQKWTPARLQPGRFGP